MDQDDEKISLLLGMGFPDVQAITRALRLSNGDMNDAVTYLTEQPLSSYSTVDDLRDVDMADATNIGAAPPDYQISTSKSESSLEFPTTHLYELESRLFVESWVIPYKKDESLGLCLDVAIKLAEEGLCETDENCQRFLDRCLPECFNKLLNSSAVRRWSSDIQEGVFNMVDLLIDLVIARLKSGCIPEEMLRHTVAMVFDTESEWNQKNKHRSSEYSGSITYADCTLYYEGYGWLVDIINIFGNRGGFELIAQCFDEKELDAGQMAGLVIPVALSVKYLVKDIISPMFQPAVGKALKYIETLEDSHLKAKRMKYCYQLLESIRTLCVSFWPMDVEKVTTLHLHMIIRMLKTPHFSSRMIALKELGTLISHSEKRNSSGLDCDFIQDWMTEKAVLPLALEGNLDQVQYTDRMKQLVEFMGPKLKEEELTKIWHLCDKASAHVVDNIHRIMIAAATRFNPHQFDHLLKLIRKSWENGNDRLREKLLSLIGKIGQDSRLSRTAEKMLDTLWELARVQSLPPHLVHLAIDEHLHILNESASREQLRKSFIIRCVEDIKRSPAVYLPLKQLHHLSKSITRGNSSYFKSEKATLSELNRSHEIVKLITQSLGKCHNLAVQANKDEPPDKDTLIDGKYSHSEYVLAHLDFLQFLLKEGGIYLTWPRCKEVWDTMISNKKASLKDKEICLGWFSQCINDLEPTTQSDLFNERLLLMDPSTLSISAFNCFYEFFHVVNLNEHKIVKSGNKYFVDSLDPIGMEYLWEIVLECLDQNLAEEAIRFHLDMSYLSLTSRLKKDPPQLHQRFISECYKKLEKSMMHVSQSVIGSAVSNATKTLTAMAVSDIASLSPSSRRTCLQHIYRILILVERYISNIEEQHSGPRILLPHAACFLGKPINITIFDDSSSNQMTLQCHSNENVGSLYKKISKGAAVSQEQLVHITFERDVEADGCEDKHLIMSCNEQENRLLHQLDLPSNAKATIKINSSNGTQLKEVGNTWNELPDVACYVENPDDSSSGSTASTPRLSMASSIDGAASTSGFHGEQRLKEEKKLPGVVMAGLGKDVFKMLYQLSLLDDNKILDAVWRVLYLVPTDPAIADRMDNICFGSMGIASNIQNMNSTPVNSPSKREKIADKSKKKETNSELLKSLLELNAMEITPFRLLYNLEVLSSKVMPLNAEATMQNSSQFCEEFLAAGGLKILTSLLHRESLPQEMNYEIRQNIYLVVLQLLSYLICGPEWLQETPISNGEGSPYPPKRSALDISTKIPKDAFTAAGGSHPSLITSKSLQNLTCDEWLEIISNIMRVTWASAAGKLYLCSSGLSSMDQSVSSPESFKSSRENSTGSGHSSGSESERSFQGGICMQKFDLSVADSLIAMQALPLLVTILSLRPNSLDKWYSLPNVKEFIIELLIGCSSSDVRDKACQQLVRLTKIQTNTLPSPSQFLSQVIHKARLPLWVSSTSARGATLRFITQCSQYFSLSSQLLSNLSKTAQEILGIKVPQMIDDEINWLTNFSTTREATRERPESDISSLRHAENILVAGHLSLITSLLSCENVDQEKCGEILINLLLNDYLFPASKLVLECSPGSDMHEASRNCSAKCTGKESRLTAYHLLVKLAVTSETNFTCLSSSLVALHHKFDQDLVKEYERSPVVDGRCSSGYVGLKNGGATCYMNSVLQQLFLVPGIQEDILAVTCDCENEESLFFQLQAVFGHLLESQLQYFIPEKFWKCFRMGGQPVNVREQQDAFEFYSRLTEQIDDYLKSHKNDRIFSRRFEGVYSIQRICQDCPHRFEREEPFLALNLTVTKCNDLRDSLDQFVKGELLEGDNAYYCEKCNKKRTAVIRTCIKTLPPILVIQLKRFGYDWEASRALKFDDYFKFPWTIDMGEYTAEALSGRDILPSPGKDKEMCESLKMDPPHSPSSFSQAMKKSPLKLSIPTSKFATPRKTTRNNYELVGVIVHSGQANAGHYYSYIKDRRGGSISNPNKSKWFKFNDTTVEYVEMCDSLLEQECFGGTYKAKVSYDSSNPMPEDRLRYWNGYLLFYESMDENPATPKTPKTPKVGRISRSLRATANSARKNLSLGVSENKKEFVSNIDSLMTSPLTRNDYSNMRTAQTSLCELSELLQEGEKKGMFRQHMPPRILSTIIHDNLTFLRDRDLYSSDYYNFVYDICASVLDALQKSKPHSSDMCIEAMSLGIRFLLNTYLRTRGKEPSTLTSWLNLLTSFFKSEPKASGWVIEYFTTQEGESHIQPLLLECPDKMVRTQFSSLLEQAISSEVQNTKGTKSVNKLMQNLLSLLANDVPSAVKTSQQYFTLLHSYCLTSPLECSHIHELDGFSSLIHFLLGSPESPKRRWSPIQAQDFGPLHSTIAALILYCNIEGYTEGTKSERHKREKKENVSLPSSVVEVLYGSQRDQWLREAVLAYREVVGGIPQLTEALKVISANDSSFTFALLTIIMVQYGAAPSNMLKDLSHLLLEILSINDSLHNERISAVLGGFVGSNGTEILGLLNIIENNKENDSRRAYQCIKLIVSLSSRSPVARDQLNSTQTNWQWAVEWLKTKMDDHPVSGTMGLTANLASFSNEDSNTKNFQRTTSAQWTLDEATALLSGMESIEMEIDCEQELEEIKESPEGENPSSESSNNNLICD